MRENSKVSVAKKYILGKFEKNESCKEKEFLNDNSNSNSGTYYSSLQILRVEKAGDPKFIDWDKNTRTGPKVVTLADQVKAYFEDCLIKGVAPERGPFLQTHCKVTAKNYGKILVRWVETKRKDNDPQFTYWDQNVRRRRISDHMVESDLESEEDLAIEDEEGEPRTPLVEEQIKQEDLRDQKNEKSIEIPIENSPREIKITKKSHQNKTTIKKINRVQNVQSKLFPANPKSPTINNLDPISRDISPISSPSQNLVKDRWGEKTAIAANYIRSRFKKDKPATFTRFQKKYPKISSGVYYAALREVKIEYQTDNRFKEWLKLCNATNKQEKKSFPKNGQMVIDEVVGFIETQLKSGGLIDFQTYLSLHPKGKKPIYQLGLLKFQVLNQNNSELYPLFNKQVPHSESKLDRFKNFLSETFAKDEKPNWSKFFDQNDDISPSSVRKFKRSWLEDQTDDYEAAEDWLKRNQTVDRACIIGQLFERAVISILYTKFQELGITLYYQTRNFIETKTGICVEGRLFVKDLNRVKEKFGPALQKFLKSCQREEIALDLTISPDIGYKYRKYADFLTALLVVIAEKLPNHQPLEHHIHSLKLEDLIGPDWFYFDPEVRKIIKEIVKDQQEALIQGRKSPAFQRLKILAREKWKKVRHHIKENATRVHYLQRVINSIFDAVISGDTSNRLKIYLQGLRQRGQITVADFLEGVARDRARRKADKPSADNGVEGGSQNYQEAEGEDKQQSPERPAVTQPNASITPENDAGAQDREEARSGSTDTPAETWAKCTAMFPDWRRLRQQQLFEEELAWEDYDRQVAAAEKGENPLQRDLTSGRVALSPAPGSTPQLGATTTHDPETAPQADPAITDAPAEDHEGHGVPTPEDVTIAPPATESTSDNTDQTRDDEGQDSDNAEPKNKNEDGEDGEDATGQESEEPLTEESREDRKNVTQTAEKTAQPVIEVTSSGGALVCEGGDPSDSMRQNGGEKRPGGDSKGGDAGNKISSNGESNTPDAGKASSNSQRGIGTDVPIPGDGKVIVTGNDLQSIRNAAAYKEGALVVDQHGKGVLLSSEDTKNIRDALDHVQQSLNNAREGACGPDPDTKIRPDGSDATGDGRQGSPVTGQDLQDIKQAGQRGEGVFITGDHGGIHLDAKDTKEIGDALDHARKEIDKARPKDARQTMDGPVVNGQDLKNANPPKDPYPIHDPQVAEGQVKIKPDDLRDIRAAGRGDVAGDVVIATPDGRKVISHEDAERINNACNRLQGELIPPSTDPGKDSGRGGGDNQNPSPAIDRKDVATRIVEGGQDLKNANPPKDPYPIHDPQVAEGQVKIKPDDLRDIRARGRGETVGDVVIETDAGRKTVSHEDAKGINNACDRLGEDLKSRNHPREEGPGSSEGKGCQKPDDSPHNSDQTADQANTNEGDPNATPAPDKPRERKPPEARKADKLSTGRREDAEHGWIHTDANACLESGRHKLEAVDSGDTASADPPDAGHEENSGRDKAPEGPGQNDSNGSVGDNEYAGWASESGQDPRQDAPAEGGEYAGWASESGQDPKQDAPAEGGEYAGWASESGQDSPQEAPPDGDEWPADWATESGGQDPTQDAPEKGNESGHDTGNDEDTDDEEDPPQEPEHKQDNGGMGSGLGDIGGLDGGLEGIDVGGEGKKKKKHQLIF